MNIGKQTFNGLIINLSISIQESIVYEIIKTQQSLEEICLPTSILEALTTIQHITSLKVLVIDSGDVTPPNPEQCQSLFLDILSRNLQTLSYVGIYPYYVTYERLTELLSLCTNLQVIEFNSCLTPQLMSPVTTAINHLHNLVYLHTFSNDITDEGIAILSQALSPNSNIRSLRLDACQQTASSFPAIITIINSCYNLQSLHLGNNEFETEANEFETEYKIS